MGADDPRAVVDSLFQEWAEVLFRHAYRLTRSREVADDLVQEAFLSFYIELRRGTAVRSPRGWMFGLVANQAARLFRNSRRWDQSSDAVEFLPAQAEETDEGASTDELMPLLKLLSPRETEVVLLRLQSLKYREIADQLGISHKSVATLLARALAKLQDGAQRAAASGACVSEARQKNATLQ
jgi:RNA polymerase sigma-70 factor (ECF subfamily)